ncbi:AH receptor-interacting protein-like [Centruroides sculpturatus]|uniref:AH receptor-interacting protein-like n=1 Tax=Centruroides sculpturatus TaxID=218467 RepID=UPI000C6E1EDD|nr:AH receptor-interacting protein-like [Centruroides sculpturatus]
MELIFGKQFKMPIWEECLKSMRIGEIAQFDIQKNFVDAYPLVSKSYRQFAGVWKGDTSSHCCGFTGMKEGLGHPDLDGIMKKPTDLSFIFELISVNAPGDYEKESWAMDPEEKLQSIPLLQEQGNEFYGQKKYKEASEKYAEALNRLEQLLLREKPGEEEWLELEKLKIPLLLNFSQCKLVEKDYYPVIEHTTTVLKKEEDNVKALFRRAKAHVGAWNPEEARADFRRVAELDPSLSNVIKNELKLLDQAEKKKNQEDKAKLCGKIFS